MISIIQLGQVEYGKGLRLQRRLIDLRKAGTIGDVLLLLEHTPVITLGRNAKAANVLASTDGKTEIVHLVNYADYPVENITVQFLGGYRRATLLTPDGAEKALQVYATEEGSGVDIDKVAVCATLRLELF